MLSCLPKCMSLYSFSLSPDLGCKAFRVSSPALDVRTRTVGVRLSEDVPTVHVPFTALSQFCALPLSSQRSPMRSELLMGTFCRAVVLNQGQFCPPGTFGAVQRYLWLYTAVERSQGRTKHPITHWKTSSNKELPSSECQ